MDWQAKLNAVVTGFEGFISLEFLSTSTSSWTVVQRFYDAKNLSLWRKSSKCIELVDELKSLAVKDSFQESASSEVNGQNGVTEVIITKVHPEKEKAYSEWSAKIHQIEAKFPGFRGVYIQSPKQNKGSHWITLLQFDTAKHLDKWLKSPERQKILQESTSLISSLENQRVSSPYAGWFHSIAKTEDIPSVWKQTMLVLLVLFPLVMLELKYLSPLTSAMGLSLSTFIGNALSVSLIAFPLMPIAIKLLGWWLAPNAKKRGLQTALGTLTVLILYLIEIALFWNFL